MYANYVMDIKEISFKKPALDGEVITNSIYYAVSSNGFFSLIILSLYEERPVSAFSTYNDSLVITTEFRHRMKAKHNMISGAC